MINKEELIQLLEQGLSGYKIADKLSIGRSTLNYWIKKYNLKSTQLSFKERSCVIRKCACGENDPSKFYGNKRYKCGKCHGKDCLERGKAKKAKARALLGDKCSYCGFNDFPVSLDIHHIESEDKDPNFNTMRGWKWEKIEIELKKCILLCKNCHSAYHAGLLDEVKYNKIIDQKIISV